jgi:hypothetical protein
MLQGGRLQVRISKRSNFLNLPNHSCHTIILGWIQPLTQMSICNLNGLKRGWLVRLTTIPTFLSWLPIKRGGLDIANPPGLLGLYRNSFIFLQFNSIGPSISVFHFPWSFSNEMLFSFPVLPPCYWFQHTILFCRIWSSHSGSYECCHLLG